jgi:HD-GYP domain-containing protein (c-di-GMP phosphodiesterase class II)
MASRLAERIELPTQQVLATRWAGRLHDLGKVVVDNSVLHKDGPLDEREWQLMRSHPKVAVDLLAHLSLTRDMLPGIQYHHERPDGRGYYSLDGEDLPVEAALIALADSFDAMTTDRPYRKALSTEEALRRIEAGLGTQFHPAFGKAFIAMIRSDQVTLRSIEERPHKQASPLATSATEGQAT